MCLIHPHQGVLPLFVLNNRKLFRAWAGRLVLNDLAWRQRLIRTLIGSGRKNRPLSHLAYHPRVRENSSPALLAGVAAGIILI